MKLVDQFIYISSNSSSIENDVNIRIDKTWSAIDRLITIWKSNLSNEMK